ncbi:MAG: hypothetical protein NTV51_17710 [Verrucomicrobia bacterium]|nr:hypothetical protein [Verrucomicrobiota bacterium]
MVVAVGETLTLVPVTTPGPGVIASDVAPVTDQPSVAESPGAIEAGEAVNDAITGLGNGAATGSVTVFTAVPAVLCAVRV